jgi:hypothetical protein
MPFLRYLSSRPIVYICVASLTNNTEPKDPKDPKEPKDSNPDAKATKEKNKEEEKSVTMQVDRKGESY